ncbi:hypothetical protein BDZ85DRAFT_315137 [Elsinoe ampelina]|uniref:Uncharacterized protein n=1 Tax=Elsinoe ampelina TaxID=302913 RepID=A0A6A6GPN3_9PEZI|nr:hypothetical protein BDZ85DRAFT_315137 [Elsinoe ampelina]
MSPIPTNQSWSTEAYLALATLVTSIVLLPLGYLFKHYIWPLFANNTTTILPNHANPNANSPRAAPYPGLPHSSTMASSGQASSHSTISLGHNFIPLRGASTWQAATPLPLALREHVIDIASIVPPRPASAPPPQMATTPGTSRFGGPLIQALPTTPTTTMVTSS